MLERLRPSSVTGPWDSWALFRLASNCFSEIILFTFSDSLSTTSNLTIRVQSGWEQALDGRWGVAGIGDAGILSLFSLVVNDKAGSKNPALMPEFPRGVTRPLCDSRASGVP